MKVSEAYGEGKFGLSFELFPPKTQAGHKALFGHLAELMKFDPSFVTCTYGAGGSTREKTLDVVQEVHQRFDCPVAAHLTCVGATADQLRSFLKEADRRGVANIVALRGDPPQGDAEFIPNPDGFSHANELVAMIHSEFPQFGIAVGGYPETHPEASSRDADLTHLKRKVDAGADVVITQLFFNNEDFFHFRDRCEKIGIRVPIVPGILPVTNFSQIQRITTLCGAKLPPDFFTALQQNEDQPKGQFEVGVEFATRQVRQLIENEAPGVHFYVLNKSQATAAVLRNLPHTAFSTDC